MEYLLDAGGPAPRAVPARGSAWRQLRAGAGRVLEALRAACRLRAEVLLLRGTLRTGGEVRLLCAGHLWNLDYLTRTVFVGVEELRRAETTVFGLHRALRRWHAQADVVLADLRWPYTGLLRRHGKWLEVPDWVRMEIALPATWEGVLGNVRRNMRQEGLRIIRREGYRGETTHDAAALADFYDRIYLPFVRERFGEESVIDPRQQVMRHGREGQLLRVLRGQQVVAAGIFHPLGDRLRLLWVGVPAGQGGTPADGAFSALYYFGLRLAFDGGYRVLDLSGTRGLLSDGVFQFKRKWGASVKDAFHGQPILIQPRNGRHETLQFCAALPALVRRKGRLEALVVRADGAIDVERLAGIARELACPGLARLTLLGIGDADGMEVLPDGPDGCQYRIVRSRADGFAGRYAAAGDAAG